MQLLSGVGSIAQTTGAEIGVAAGLGVVLSRRPQRPRVEWWDDVDRRWR